MDKITGIDVSKQTFDCCIPLEGGKTVHKKLSNDNDGFEKLLKLLPEGSHVVMEASGAYYYRLAYFLHGQHITVSVVNPLVIRRFCQMRMARTKTDKKDAGMIREYGMSERLDSWQPEEKSMVKIKQINGMLDLVEKTINMYSNQLEAYEQMPDADTFVTEELRKAIDEQQKKRKVLEAEMEKTVVTEHGQTYKALLSIPGIGPKSAAMLIAITGNFKKFQHHKQLCAYVGLNPSVFESGTSVRGRGHISKMGTARLRKLLYICTWTARSANTYCKDLYERLKKKSKPPMVISIALANKLLKQAFAVGKSLTHYQNNLKINLVN